MFRSDETTVQILFSSEFCRTKFSKFIRSDIIHDSKLNQRGDEKRTRDARDEEMAGRRRGMRRVPTLRGLLVV